MRSGTKKQYKSKLNTVGFILHYLLIAKGYYNPRTLEYSCYLNPYNPLSYILTGLIILSSIVPVLTSKNSVEYAFNDLREIWNIENNVLLYVDMPDK